MSEEKKKNNRSSRRTDRKEHSQEYRFIRETIKQKPIDRRQAVRRAAATAASAVLFGIVAAVVFAAVFPTISEKMNENQKSPPVDISVTEPPDTPEVTPAPQTVTQAPPAADENITLEDYENIFEDVHVIAQKSLRAMVTVTGVEEGGDLLSHSSVSFGNATGVIIARSSRELYILTEEKALGKDSSQVLVNLCDGQMVEGELKKADISTGLAVVTVAVKDIPEESLSYIHVAPLGNAYSLIQGKPVIAIGSPSGYNESVAYGNMISVSNKVSVVDAEYNLLVTDILGSREGSGVLLDTEGNVIGIIAQSFGGDSDTMVKALAVSQLKSLLAALSNGKDILYAGIYGQDVTETIAQKMKLPTGIYVDAVDAESPAMEAGIQSADVITEFNGKEVATMQNFSRELQKCKAGEKVPLKLMRKGSEGYVEMEFKITTGILERQ